MRIFATGFERHSTHLNDTKSSTAGKLFNLAVFIYKKHLISEVFFWFLNIIKRDYYQLDPAPPPPESPPPKPLFELLLELLLELPPYELPDPYELELYELDLLDELLR